jgi:hypothetical protein
MGCYTIVTPIGRIGARGPYLGGREGGRLVMVEASGTARDMPRSSEFPAPKIFGCLFVQHVCILASLKLVEAKFG